MSCWPRPGWDETTVKVRKSIQIEAPPARVLELLMDVHRLGEWVKAHRSIVEEPEGQMREGSTFRQKLRVGGVSFKVRWTVTELDAPRLVEWRGDGPGGSDARVCYSLTPADGGTAFEYVNEFHLPGGKLAEAAGKAIGEDRAAEEAETSLRALKELIEGQDGRGTTPRG
jgi:uncharacterized protein YndB with AHSA1/START domain